MAEQKFEPPLAAFRGERPPRPDWYDQLDIEPHEIVYVVVDGARIEVLVWGELGRPGLLLAHGSLGHARWWGPVTPLLARHYRVASFSWSGMGRSDWREAYSIDQQIVESFAAANAGGLMTASQPPIFAAHSFGSRALTLAAAKRGAELSGAIIVDGAILPDRPARMTAMRPRPPFRSPADALARFTLAPYQAPRNSFILDDIARGSIRETDEGWRWCFDPNYFANYSYTDVWPALAEAKCPLAIVYGEESSILTAEGRAIQRRHAPQGTPFIGIPNAGHHIMIDEPVALAVALQSLAETWLGTEIGRANSRAWRGMR